MLLPINALLGVLNGLLVKLDWSLFKQWQNFVNITSNTVISVRRSLFISFYTLRELTHKVFDFF